jgi:hypothetical protein
MIPSVPSTGVTVKAFPLQMVEAIGLTAGLVTTVTVSVNVLPTQLPDVGVIV